MTAGNSGVDPVETGAISSRLDDIRERIGQAAGAAGRSADDVTILAATKTMSPARVHAVIEAGIRLIGENRIQEAEVKKPEVGAADGVAWHFIGHLQSNKARAAFRLFDVVESVDTLGLAETLDRVVREADREGRLPVLLEVNTSGEGTKHGFEEVDFQRALQTILSLPNLDVRGLMTVGPLTTDQQEVREAFRRLAALRDRAAGEYPAGNWQVLSMGMSDDFEIAVQEGSTLIRLGRALFGPRS